MSLLTIANIVKLGGSKEQSCSDHFIKLLINSQYQFFWRSVNNYYGDCGGVKRVRDC
jgi:hypothetical protein